MANITRTMAPTLMIMSHPAVHGPNPQSFEELRMEDYIKAYQSTGRPPIPCPELPTDDAQRRALSLPPIFRPFPEGDLTVSIPEVQAAQPFNAVVEGDETFHSISSMLGYRGYSFEELRVYAYQKGYKSPPTPVTMDPFTTSSTLPEIKSPAPLLSSNEQFQHIIGQPEFSQHSPEELRVAYMRLGRELNSEDILRCFGPTPINAMKEVTYVPPPPGGSQPSSLMHTNGTSNPFQLSAPQPASSLFGALGSTSTSTLAPAATIASTAAPLATAPAISTFGLFGSSTAPVAPAPTPTPAAIAPPSTFGFTPNPLFAAPTATTAVATPSSFQFGLGTTTNASAAPKFRFG